ncbi:hypothetical protein [Dinghuibacter silviterrae]|uniref:hypothetical protein n=1 Tax=Dinghuibacter silviterrae TaxID=1539049 RepID=UPI00106406D5|nr:hypothetical protein [Dinghuibacter silviterrae]
MIKAKIMLYAIAVLTVVAGDLAFNARTNDLITFCTTTLEGGNSCSIQSDLTPTTQGPNIYKYTTVEVGENCDDNTLCQGNTTFTHF